MAKRRFFSGETVEQAVLEAAGYHELEPAEVSWREVAKRHGFLRVRRNVVIEVDPEAPRRAPATATVASPATAEPVRTAEGEGAPAAPSPTPPEPVVAPPPATGPAAAVGPAERQSPPEPERGRAAAAPRTAATAAGETEVRAVVELLLELSDLAVDPAVAVHGGEVRVDLAGPEEGFLQGDDGELLKVFEMLALRMLGGPSGPVEGLRIDSGGIRERRESTLRERALAAAREVATGGESVLLESMDAADRRVVHLAVEPVAGVITRSEGRGEEKRVRILRQERPEE
jgi:spoIIIJ-associated protein